MKMIENKNWARPARRTRCGRPGETQRGWRDADRNGERGKLMRTNKWQISYRRTSRQTPWNVILSRSEFVFLSTAIFFVLLHKIFVTLFVIQSMSMYNQYRKVCGKFLRIFFDSIQCIGSISFIWYKHHTHYFCVDANDDIW